jgi:hypothetical protein
MPKNQLKKLKLNRRKLSEQDQSKRQLIKPINTNWPIN